MIGKLAAATWLAAIGLVALADDAVAPRLRRPIALALLEDGKRLLVANRDSGTVAIVDPSAGRVVSETRVGRRLSDLAVTPDGSRIAVIDEAAGELIVLTLRDGVLKTIAH